MESAEQSALDDYWGAIGRCEPDRISYIVNPMFMGAPAWPGTRQAYRVVRRSDTVILASDGLSDGPGAGFGCEVYLETPDLVGVAFDALMPSWQFAVIESFAQNVAGWGGISQQLRKHGMLSTELPVDTVPEHLMSPRGTVGCLVGMPVDRRPAQVQRAEGLVDIVPVTVITPVELDHAMTGSDARRTVAEHRIDARWGHLSIARDG